MASAAVASPLDGEVSRHGEHQLLLQVWNPPSAAPLAPMHDTTLLGWKSLDSGGCDHRQLNIFQQQPQPSTPHDKWGAASVRSFIHITSSMCQCGRWPVWCGIWRPRTHTRCLPTTCFAFAHFCPSLSQRHIQSVLLSVAHAHHHAVCVGAVALSPSSSSHLLARCHHRFALHTHLDAELL